MAHTNVIPAGWPRRDVLLAFVVTCGVLACGRSELSRADLSGTANPDGQARSDGVSLSDVVASADPVDALPSPGPDLADPNIRPDLALDSRSPLCGNGRLEAGEECDDANAQAGDGCDPRCRRECDFGGCADGPFVSPIICGDGVVRASEGCDDGNVADGDGCSQSCSVERGYKCRMGGLRCVPICGDDVIVGLETCDDGNTTGGDGCSPFCLVEECWDCSRGICRPQPVAVDAGTCPRPPSSSCGNGRVDGAEECDQGPDNSDRTYGGCSTQCRYLVCGDGIVSEPEACDEGAARNTAVYGDRTGCTSACAVPHYCGDGIVDAAFGEMCDVGDGNGSRYCTPRCIVWLP